MKYTLGAIGLVVGYIVSYGFFYFLEYLDYGRVTSAVVYDDYGIAIVIGCLVIGLIFMAVGQSVLKKRSNNKQQ